LGSHVVRIQTENAADLSFCGPVTAQQKGVPKDERGGDASNGRVIWNQLIFGIPPAMYHISEFQLKEETERLVRTMQLRVLRQEGVCDILLHSGDKFVSDIGITRRYGCAKRTKHELAKSIMSTEQSSKVRNSRPQ